MFLFLSTTLPVWNLWSTFPITYADGRSVWVSDRQRVNLLYGFVLPLVRFLCDLAHRLIVFGLCGGLTLLLNMEVFR